MPKMKISSEKKLKSRPPRKINGLYTSRLLELIASGQLKTKGVDGIFQVIQKEFNSQVHGLTKKSFHAKVNELTWTKDVDKALRDIVGHDLPLKKFAELHSHIPMKMIEERARWLSGIGTSTNPATFLRGLGRIGELEGLDENFELPKTSRESPVVIQTGKSNPTILHINGANIGLKHERLIKENVIRRSFVDARQIGDSAIIITNTMDLDVKKAAGPASIFRAFFSGRNINIDILDPSYQAKARRIKDNPKSLESIYESTSEKLLNILSGWAKISKKLDGSGPEYEGKVYVIFGHNESELIAAAAYWELRRRTMLKWHKLAAEIRLIKSGISSAQKRGLGPSQVKELERGLEALINEQSRTIISNISIEDRQKFYRRALAFVVTKFEEAVPNSKVIGHGSTYIQVDNNKPIKFSIPGHARVGDQLLVEAVRSYGPKLLTGEMPDAEIVCHPTSLNKRYTVRESVVNGQRGSIQFFVAPIAVDGEFLAEAFRGTGNSAHPIAKAVFSGQFKPGLIRLNYCNGMLSVDDVSIDSLAKSSNRAPAIVKTIGDTYYNQKFIWVFTATDPHFGSRAREEFWCSSRQQYLGVSDGAIQMMREAGLFEGKLPAHFYNVNDDWTQGNHFDTHKQPDQHAMSYQKVEKLSNEKFKYIIANLRSNPERAIELLNDYRLFNLDQFRSRGVDWLQEQIIQVLERHIEPNADFWNALLSNSLRAGLVLKGVSEHENVGPKGEKFDQRDVGFINCGTGNHIAATIQDNLTEGFIYADKIRTMLKGMPKWQDKLGFLEKSVVAPLYGNKFFAWGTVKAPGGYEWGLEFRSDPPRMGSWSDPLLGAVKNDSTRADYGKFMTGRVTLKTYGDKHFYSQVVTDYAIYHMCASGTHTDPYGERGFPPNNTGVSFVGLPVNGPDSGPILLRTLRVEHIRDYFKSGKKIDWSLFLPNPV